MTTRYFKSETTGCCSSPAGESKSTELKIYQAFIFTVPIFFIFILLFLFYLFYLRRRRVDWDSLRMRASAEDNIDISRTELGVKKELREMLPIIVYKESFSVNDTQCPVCLGDYQSEDRLQQIPACSHTFHMECIDSWLANHTTCPLCRLSLLPPNKVPSESQENQRGIDQEFSAAGDSGETSVQQGPPSGEESEHTLVTQSRNGESWTLQINAEEEKTINKSADRFRETINTRNHTEEHEIDRVVSA